MKNLLIVISIVIVGLFSTSTVLNAQIYGGIGLGYSLPMGDMQNYSPDAYSVILEIESRQYCRIWFGSKIEYFMVSKEPNLLPEDNFYINGIVLSPTFRYNFLPDDCYNYDFVPYGKVIFNLSSLSDEKQNPQLGFGMGFGAGAAQKFSLFDRCMMIDGSLAYTSLNGIARSKNRYEARMITATVTLSVELR